MFLPVSLNVLYLTNLGSQNMFDRPNVLFYKNKKMSLWVQLKWLWPLFNTESLFIWTKQKVSILLQSFHNFCHFFAFKLLEEGKLILIFNPKIVVVTSELKKIYSTWMVSFIVLNVLHWGYTTQLDDIFILKVHVQSRCVSVNVLADFC